MDVTRRTLIKGALGAAGAATAGGLSTGAAAADSSRRGEGTTLDRTIVRGTPGAGGYAVPHLRRR